MGLRRSVLSLCGVGWFPLLSGKVLDGGGLRDARGSQDERRRRNVSRRRGTVAAGYIYMYILLKHIQVFVFDAILYLWKVGVCNFVDIHDLFLFVSNIFNTQDFSRMTFLLIGLALPILNS